MKFKLVIRDYRRTDEAVIKGLWRDCELNKPWNDPTQDIDALTRAQQAQLLVGELDGQVVTSAAAAYDGHRGWVYYVCVAPALQSQGMGRAIMAAAEKWLAVRGVDKVQLLIRPENKTAHSFYAAIGYHVAPRTIMQKWLNPPTQVEFEELGNGSLTTTISFLEMRERPKRRYVPSPGGKLALMRASPPTVAFYRHLYELVGETWFWWERRVLSDNDLDKIIRDPQVEIYVLYIDGVPAGFSEINLRRRPTHGIAEISYLGLVPTFIGRGYGNYLLNWTIDAAWQHKPRVVTVNTCTLDHPHALSFYQRSGFTIVSHKKRIIIDPRLTGVIPPDTPLPATSHSAEAPERGESLGDNVTHLPRHH